MKKIPLVARILLGLIFAFSGISFFFMTPPPLPEGPMADFFKGLMGTHYFFYLLKVTESVCGLLLLSGMFVPLALVILAPIIINIFMVHAFMMPQGLPLALVVGGLEIYLTFFSPYGAKIRALFQAK
ncbi:MAG TPA: DoxX family membrane protein [Bdellovibrionota bacterium]|nr:DoxX family membrane protein [Bdellovibrionota bacterium]